MFQELSQKMDEQLRNVIAKNKDQIVIESCLKAFSKSELPVEVLFETKFLVTWDYLDGRGEVVKVVRFKELKLPTTAMKEGEKLCQKNPYIMHAEHEEEDRLHGTSCIMGLEEVEMTEEEYARTVEKYHG